MAAELEKPVLRRDLFNPENLRPDAGDLGLQCAADRIRAEVSLSGIVLGGVPALKMLRLVTLETGNGPVGGVGRAIERQCSRRRGARGACLHWRDDDLR